MIIKKLSLSTTSLKEQINFYQRTLGLSMQERKEHAIVFSIGHTLLEFSETSQSDPYHFAINIPSNKARGALSWLKERVPILKDGEKELIDFDSWSAESIYFYDYDKNIVELIAREKLEVIIDRKFKSKYFLSISEIGMPVDNIEETYNQLKSIKDIDIFDGNFDKFCAIGDESGLFIVIDKNKKRWYPTNDIAHSSSFSIEGDYNFRFSEGRIIV